MMESSAPIGRACGFAKAISEEIRVRILMCLRGGPLGLQHFVDIFELAPSTLSKHLHILENAGLLVSIRQGRWRLYQWPDKNADETTRELLEWLARAASEDALLQADSSRRAVAVQSNPVPLPKSDVTRVLFLCTGNSCRSQMAEALLRKKGDGRFEVASAGVSPRDIPPLTMEVMDDIGLDISGQRPKSVMEFIGKTHFDYLITVCDIAADHTPVFPGVTHRLHWPMEDPAAIKGGKAKQKKVFKKVRDALDARISQWLDEMGRSR